MPTAMVEKDVTILLRMAPTFNGAVVIANKRAEQAYIDGDFDKAFHWMDVETEIKRREIAEAA